jgi:hypothetical protein
MLMFFVFGKKAVRTANATNPSAARLKKPTEVPK